jgi:cyclopropane fatty-acyl-phospholipid synthase-like methyltransferase
MSLVQPRELARTESQAAQAAGYPSVSRYRQQCEFVFKGIPLAGKRVLDVGCGRGAFVLWAAINGAELALGVEPEAAGGQTGSLGALERSIRSLGLTNAVARSSRLEDLTPDADGRFDVIVLFNTINHLDEAAVCRLHESAAAQERYASLLTRLWDLTSGQGVVIVADSGSKNLWRTLGRRPRFVRSLEWEKHQQPGVWSAVFSRLGFEIMDLRWSPVYPTPWLTGNRVGQWALWSHFVLRFVKPGLAAAADAQGRGRSG